MERVTGVGGLLFRAPNPGAIARWHQEHLGVTLPPPSYDEAPWCREAGPTVFAPFPEATPYFGDPAKGWMVNSRVSDPVGNPIQLWGPKRSGGPGSARLHAAKGAPDVR